MWGRSSSPTRKDSQCRSHSAVDRSGRPIRGRAEYRRARTDRNASAASSSGLFVLLAVAGILGVAWIVRGRSGSPEIKQPAVAVAEPVVAAVSEPGTEAEPVAEAETEAEAEPEAEPEFEPEVVRRFEVVTEPDVVSEAVSAEASVPDEPPPVASAPAEAPAPQAEAKAPAQEENKYFTLVLSGSLGGVALSGRDAQTWARLAYSLREEAQVPHFLVFPGGGMPLVVPPGGSAKAKKAVKPKPGPQPRGDPKAPTYRIVLDAQVSSAGGITFYGTKLGSRWRVTLTGRIEKRSGDDFTPVETIFESSEHTPTASDPTDPKVLARKLYDVALEGLAQKLSRFSMLRG